MSASPPFHGLSAALLQGRRAGMAMAAIGAIAFSGKAIVVKLAYQHGVDAVTLLMLRMLLALPFFLVLAWVAGRGKPALSGRDWLGIAWLGFTGYYAASFLDFAGLAYISAGLERLILYLNPTLVVALNWLLYRKRVHPWQVLAMLISYAGVLLVFGMEASLQGSHVVWGSTLVLGSAISYAFYLVYSGQLVQKLGALRLVGLASVVASVLCIGQFVLSRPLDSVWLVTAPVWWLSVFNAIFCTVIPILLVMMAIERIGSGMAAQVGMIGPLSTIGLGIWILDEHFSWVLVLGTALVMAGILLFSRWSLKGPASRP